jgi:alpha-1,3-rhamnosyl/mannosyltransferase
VAPLGYASRFHLRDQHTLQQQLRPIGVDPDTYVLCVGTLEPRKNLTLALRAHALLPHDLRSRFPLLIVGMSGWKMHHLTHELDQALRSGHVRLLGYQSDDQVAALTAGARLMLFPSRYEGFGLPVLEAMASGTPVMLAKQAAMPEVAGDAGIYVPLDDEEVWAGTLQQYLLDEGLRDHHCQQGLKRATQFSWQHCASITANVYRKVLQS